MLGSPKRSALCSAFVHGSAIVVILALTSVKPLILPHALQLDTKVFTPRTIRMAIRAGGGGGGPHSNVPVSKGQEPRRAPQMIVPPIQLVHVINPPLMVEPTILAPADSAPPKFDMSIIGSPHGVGSSPSLGNGKDGLLGDGEGSKFGPGDGPGNKTGKGGPDGSGGNGRKFTQPIVQYQTEPEFSEEARKAKLQGTVELSIVVGVNGRVTSVRVIRGLGLGLDERAMESVRQWRFKPATLDGKPVPATAGVEVNFRLL